MPSMTQTGVIKPLASEAVRLIQWKLRDIGEPQSRTVMEHVPVCANCHSFSAAFAVTSPGHWILALVLAGSWKASQARSWMRFWRAWRRSSSDSASKKRVSGRLSDAGRSSPGVGQRHGETARPCETPSARDGQNHGHFCHPVESVRRDDQDRTAAPLLVARSGIEVHQPDFAALHQMSSRPFRLPPSHSCSSRLRHAPGLHWARSSSSV